jgi:hypothetical protein
MPKTIRSAPMTTRAHDAQPGGLSRSPPARPEISSRIAVSTASPKSQPARKARPVGRGRGVCNTITAGMIDSGDNATTSASGMSSVSTEPQLADIARPFVALLEERSTAGLLRRDDPGQLEG